jgi:lysophospholipase L1-like esterase
MKKNKFIVLIVTLFMSVISFGQNTTNSIAHTFPFSNNDNLQVFNAVGLLSPETFTGSPSTISYSSTLPFGNNDNLQIYNALRLIGATPGFTNGSTATVNKTSEIYTMGDSQTSSGGYQAQLVSLLGSPWITINVGIPGNTTTQMVNRFSSVITATPNTVIILGGANDLIGSVGASTIIANLQAMCTAAKNNGARVVLMTTTPFGANVGWSAGKQTTQNTLNAAILSSTAITNVDVRLDIYTLLGGGTNSLLPAYNSGDGLHWNAAGQIAVGNYIYANTGFTVTAGTPTLTLAHNLILDQNLSSSSTPVWEGAFFNGTIRCDNDSVICNNLLAENSITAISLYASSNCTINGICYSNNTFALGPLGTNGSITSAADVFKILAGATASTIAFCTPSRSNGSAKLFDDGRFVVGNISSVPTWTQTNYTFQNFGASITPTLIIGNNTTNTNSPILQFRPINANNSSIDFLNSAGSATIAQIVPNASTGEVRYYAHTGNMFPTFYSNGLERMRIGATGNVSINNTVTTTATLNVTGSFSASTTGGFGGALTGGGSIASTSKTGGIGYAVGSGSTVTQATSRTTAVTINAITGQVTLFSAAGSAAWQSFTMTNSSITAKDVLVISWATSTDIYMTSVKVAAGSAVISFATTGGTTVEAPIFNYTVIKGQTN